MKQPLGQAGSEEGVPYVYHWSIFKVLIRLFPLLLPLLCMALPWNRNRQALLLLVPYGLAIAFVIGATVFGVESPAIKGHMQDLIVYIGITVTVLAVLWAVAWSLMPWLGRLWPGAALVLLVLLFAVGGAASLYIMFLEPVVLMGGMMFLGGYATMFIGITALIRLVCLRGQGRRFRIFYMALAHVAIGLAFFKPLHVFVFHTLNFTDYWLLQAFNNEIILLYLCESMFLGITGFVCLWPYLLLAYFSKWHRAHLNNLLRWHVPSGQAEG